MIAILDYGLGNLKSIQNMLKLLEVESIITSDFEKIKASEKIILPGVGAFDEGMKRLNDQGLADLIRKETLEQGKPLLGICLGMQLLGRGSEEGREKGLNLISFDTVKFKTQERVTYKIPHMGWEKIKITQPDCKLIKEIIDGDRFYFVHSYHAVCDNIKHEILSCEYGYHFTAAIWDKNIYGVQFHPEKSHKFGMKILYGFSKM